MIRLATAADWPTIELWRAGHYARMEGRNGLASARGTALGAAVWIVVDDRRRGLLAAVSFYDTPPVRTLYDFYFAPGFAGRRAAYVLAGTVLRFAAELELELVGNTNISNVEYRALLRRCGFRTYRYDQAHDVCYFKRETQEGFGYVGQFRERNPNKRQSSRLSVTAGDDAGANYNERDRE